MQEKVVDFVSTLDDASSIPANLQNLKRLFLLRNIFIGGAALGVGISHFQLHIHVSYFSLFVVIFSLVILNLLVLGRIRTVSYVSDNELFFQLLVDICALAVLLYFTGGATNPFIILFIFPLAISVTILPKRYAWVLALASIVFYSILMFQYQPIGMDHSSHSTTNSAFGLHIVGMWLAFILCASLITYYAIQMRNTIRNQEVELQKAKENALRDKQIIALGTLAASTAHEMGTPLGTIQLIASELKNELKDAPQQLKTDLETLRQQVERCKEALSNLSVNAGAVHLSSGNISNTREYLQDLLDNWRMSHADVHLVTHWSQVLDSVDMHTDKTLSQAIVNILDNAADASPQHVEWDADICNNILQMEIRDRGRGLSELANKTVGKKPYSEKEKGLGIGLFLSHAIVERFGGRVDLANREGGGLITQISIPLQVVG